MILHHITLLTGDSATHRLDTLDQSVIDACKQLLPAGGTIPAFAAWRVEIHGPIFTIWRGAEPVVTCLIGGDTDPVWTTLVDLQKRCAPGVPIKAKQPQRGVWLAVALLPGLANAAQSDIGWLGDFERCLAAAILQTTHLPGIYGPV